MTYRVFFEDGSSDQVEAGSAAEARDVAEADFGGKVARVQFLGALSAPGGVDDGDEDDDFDEDENGLDDAEDDDDEEE